MGNPRIPKWKIVENVAAAIERSLNSIQGAKVVPNASIPELTSGVQRQVDVYVEIPTGSRTLRVGIEVRDESVAVDLPEIEGLISKLNKLGIDRGCIASRAGFTATAKAEADRNGIELRTVAEVEYPEWWAVSEILIRHRQVEPVRYRLNYPREQLAGVKAFLEGVRGIDLELTLPTAESTTIQDFVTHLSLEALNEPDAAGLVDQDTFRVKYDFRGRTGFALRCPNGPVSLPESLDALYRLHLRNGSVSITAYQQPTGVHAFTGVSAILDRQITLVSELQSDDRRSISFTWQHPSPPKTVVPPRRDKPDGSD